MKNTLLITILMLLLCAIHVKPLYADGGGKRGKNTQTEEFTQKSDTPAVQSVTLHEHAIHVLPPRRMAR